MKKSKKIFSLFLSFILLLCAAVVYADAEEKAITEIKILKEPDKKIFYQDEDWVYGMWDQSEANGGIYIVPSTKISFTHNPCMGRVPERGMLDMNGLVIDVSYSDGTTETMEYEETKNSRGFITSNIFFAPVGEFHTGINTIYVYLKANVYCRATYQIEIKEKEPEAYFGLKENSTAQISKNGFITGLKTKLTAAELMSNFDYENVELKLTLLSQTSRYCGTGTTITVTYPDKTQEIYTVIIYGDIDGNSIIDSNDVSMVTKAASKVISLKPYQEMAARVNHGTRLTISDVSVISKSISSGQQINQTNPAYKK